MSSSSDECIDVLFLDLEVDVQPVELRVFDVVHNRVHHVQVVFAFYVLILQHCAIGLDPDGLKWSIVILVGRYQADVFEPPQTWVESELVEQALLDVFLIREGQLGQTHVFLPLLQNPHARVNNFVGVVQVPQVGSRQRHVGVHQVFVLCQVLDRAPDYDPAQRVPDEADPPKRISWAVVRYVRGYLVGKLQPHLVNVSVCVIFVDARAQEHRLGVQVVQVILQ